MLPHDLTLLRDIALGIVFAALAAHVARVLRQPLILGYIAGGVLLSPRLGLGLVTNADSTATDVTSGLNSIDGGAFSHAAGITTVIQNSGSNVLVQNGTAVNLQFTGPTP